MTQASLRYYSSSSPFLQRFIYFYVCMFCLSVSMCTMCTQFLRRSEDGARSPGIGVTDDYELLCECLDWNPGSLQKHQMLLIVDPSLQHLPFLFLPLLFHAGDQSQGLTHRRKTLTYIPRVAGPLSFGRFYLLLSLCF